MRDVPIYAKTLKYYCSKKPGKKPRDMLTIHVMGRLSDIMLRNTMPVKYGDPGNPILTVQINGVEIPDLLVYLGVVINIITSKKMNALGLKKIKPTPTILELADRSTIKPVGKLEDVNISVDSWHYLVDLLVLQT